MTTPATPGPVAASCYCGAVRLRSGFAPTSVIHCHCGQCRRLSGAAFTTWVSLSRKGLSVTGEASLTAFAATANVTRHFCKLCGSHLFTSDRRMPSIVGVPAGAVEDASVIRPESHYFVDHKAAWHCVGDSLPRLGGESGDESTAAGA